MQTDVMQTLNIIVSIIGFALTAARIGGLLATIGTKLDGVSSDVARMARDVERLQQVVQIHGEKIAAIEARIPHA